MSKTSGTVTTPSTMLVSVGSAVQCDRASATHFAAPVGATDALLNFFTTMSDAAPGTYTSASACGGVVFCVQFNDATERCYQAEAADSCVGPATAVGDWTLTLTSVIPYGGGSSDHIVHGTLEANVIAYDPKDGAAHLSIGF